MPTQQASWTDDDGPSVLQLRFATLKKNLQHVKGTESSVARRRREIRDLETVFDDLDDGIQVTAENIVDDLEDCRRTLSRIAKALTDETGAENNQVKRLESRLASMAEDARGLKKKARRSAAVSAAMTRRWAALASDNDFDGHVREIFEDEAERLIAAIDALDGNPAVAWRTFQKEIRTPSETLFSEYVEFLGGLALRDTGLGGPFAIGEPPRPADDGDPGEAEEPAGPDVCVMADDLIRQIYRIGSAEMWHSLTIPARRDAAARTLARMIRLGFPEWTIWAVPLAAHEFGRVVIDKTEAVDAYADTFGGVRRGLQTALADVFATYAMGPAYAFACVYVLLDPGDRPDHGRPADLAGGPMWSDSCRVQVVISTLEMMNESSVLDPVIDELEKSWSAAVDQAGGDPLPTGDMAGELEEVVAFAWDFLQEKARSVGYAPKRWAAVVTEWSSLCDLVAQEGLRPGVEDVRDILNAAWHQRLEANWGPRRSEQDLAAAALALWQRGLVRRRKRAGRTPKGI